MAPGVRGSGPKPKSDNDYKENNYCWLRFYSILTNISVGGIFASLILYAANIVNGWIFLLSILLFLAFLSWEIYAKLGD